MNVIFLLFLSCWQELPELPDGYCYQGEASLMSFEFCEKNFMSEKITEN